MLADIFTRMWENLISRPTGPMKFRFLLQPAMAIFFATRGGLKEFREGKPPYFWSLFVDSVNRRELLRDGWKSIGKVFILALILDGVYQIIVLRWIYPFETLVVAFVLAIIPYLLVRGLVNRIATIRKTAARKSTAGRP